MLDPTQLTQLDDEANNRWQLIFDGILKDTDLDAQTFQSDVVDWYSQENNDANIAISHLRDMGTYLDTILDEWIKDKTNIKGFAISKKQSEGDI